MNLQELSNSVGVTALIIGLPGSGKTSSIRNLNPERTLILTSEPQQLTVLLQFKWNHARCTYPQTIQDWDKAISEATKETDVDTVVVDTLSSFHDLFMETYIDEKKRKENKKVDELGRDLYRVANLQFQQIMRKIFKIPQNKVNLILLCHMKYREVGEVQYKQPSLSDNLTNWICRQCDLVLRAERIVQGKDERYLLCRGGGADDFGSDKYGIVKDIVDNDMQKIFKLIEKKKGQRLKKRTKNSNKRDEKSLRVEDKTGNEDSQGLDEPEPAATPVFEMKREDTKVKLFEDYKALIAEAPTCTFQEGIAFLEETAKKKLKDITRSQMKTAIKKFKEKYLLPF